MSRGGLSAGNEKKEKIPSNDNALDWNPPTMSEFRDVPITNTHGGTNSLSINLHYRLMKTCIKWSKRRDQYLVNNRETIKNDKRNPLYIFSTKIIQCSWASWSVKKAKQNYLLRIFRAHRVLTHKVFLPLSLKTPSTEKGIISVLNLKIQISEIFPSL